MFIFHPCQLPGCYLIEAQNSEDARGSFTKTFNADTFAEQGLETNFVESFYSCSKRNVIRGLHFQSPPADHAKLVYCTAGSAWDVLVDLRLGSPTYGTYESFTLDETSNHCLYIPRGFAHGFCCTSDECTLMYHVSSVFAPAHDKGIHWDSLRIPWPTQSPIISERDKQLPTFSEFESPFIYG